MLLDAAAEYETAGALSLRESVLDARLRWLEGGAKDAVGREVGGATEGADAVVSAGRTPCLLYGWKELAGGGVGPTAEMGVGAIAPGGRPPLLAEAYVTPGCACCWKESL